MVQLNSKSANATILPSWMPFISKTPQLMLTTEVNAKNETISYEKENSNDNIFTAQDFLKTLAFSDNLMLDHLKDQAPQFHEKVLNLKNEISENFWNWTLQVCWMIRCFYLKEFDLEAMVNYENEIKKNNGNVHGKNSSNNLDNQHHYIHWTLSELTTLTNHTTMTHDEDNNLDQLKEEYEYDVILDILSIHQNLCLDLSNIEKGVNVENEKKIFFLWWFMSYNLLKVFNKKLFIYEEQEFDKMMRSEMFNEQDTFNKVKIIYSDHSKFDYFSEDMLSFAKHYLQSFENNSILVFSDDENDNDKNQENHLWTRLFANTKFKYIPMTFNSFSLLLKNNNSISKEKAILESIKASKNITEFTVTKQLGKGSSGFVRTAIHNQTGKKVIIKYVVKSLVLRGCWTNSSTDGSYSKRIPNEIAVLQYIHDQYNGDVPKDLTTLISSWEDSIYYYLVFADTADFDSDLFDYIDRNQNSMMSEAEAKIIFRNILKAVQTLHHHNIVHRDIKDENVLINDETKEIQLIDFGSSAFYKKNQKLSNFVGSFLFAAPEIIKGMTYDGPPQDIWSLGILLYTMIYKTTPFQDYYEILRKKMTFPKAISNECKELILWMTNRTINDRPTIDQVLEHPWLN